MDSALFAQRLFVGIKTSLRGRRLERFVAVACLVRRDLDPARVLRAEGGRPSRRGVTATPSPGGSS